MIVSIVGNRSLLGVGNQLHLTSETNHTWKCSLLPTDELNFQEIHTFVFECLQRNLWFIQCVEGNSIKKAPHSPTNAMSIVDQIELVD